MGEFKVNEKVYCYHQQVLYPAKILKKKGSGATAQYYIHYDGWNKKWDEWVGLDGVMPINEETDKLRRKAAEDAKKALKKKAAAKKKTPTKPVNKKRKISKEDEDGGGDGDEDGAGSGAGAGAGAGAGTGAGAGSGKAAAKTAAASRDAEENSIEESQPPCKYKLAIPFALKQRLVEDWELVNQKQCLCTLPKPTTVASVLEEFLTVKKQRSSTDKIIAEVVEGLRQYFDRALGAFLLYRFERHQYEDYVAKNPDTPMSEVYGPEHLLRLFVKLPQMLVQAEVDEADYGLLSARLTDFLKFLHKNQARFFSGSGYAKADATYMERYDALPPLEP